MQVYIDTHAHMDDPRLGNTGEVLEEAKKQGVAAVIAPSVNLPSAFRLKELSSLHREIYFAPGVHCHEADGFRAEDTETVKELLNNPKAVAVGEVGLDYHYDFSEKSVQKETLERFIGLAEETDKPLILHCREAEEDMYEILEKYKGRIRGVIHCFTGNSSWALKFTELGLYIGFTGFITFKKSVETREALRSIPQDRILAETDAPYMAPVPHRGKVCSPALLPLTIRAISEERGLSTEKTAEILLSNTCRLFGLRKEDFCNIQKE